MNFKLFTIALVVLSVNVRLNSGQQPTTLRCDRIVAYCHRELVMKEIYYTGECNLRDPYPLLTYARSYIQNADNQWTIDYFLRNYLLINATNYYRTTYEGIVDPVNLNKALDDLINEYNVFLDKFKTPGTLAKMLVIELTDPIYTTKFDDIFTILPNLYPQVQLCELGSTFCTKTQELLGKECTYEITRIPIVDLLTDYFNRIYDAVVSQAPLQTTVGKRAIDSLIENLNEKGSENVFVWELKNFTSNEFYRLIAEFNSYDPIEVTRASNPRPNTTTITRFFSPTTRQKVIDVTAINPVVLYSIPPILVLFGFVAAVSIIAFIYAWRPVKSHFPENKRHDKSKVIPEELKGNAPQTIEMEPVNKKF